MGRGSTDLAIGRHERAYLKASVDQRDQEREEESDGASARLRSSGDRPADCGAWSPSSRPRRSSPDRSPSSRRSRAAGRSARPGSRKRGSSPRPRWRTSSIDPELSILLAIEAVRTTRSSDGTVLPEAEEALHRAVVASRLELEVPGAGGALAWSPTGVFVTEGPEGSGMIDIRDGESGESVLSFQGHDGDINDVAFSSRRLEARLHRGRRHC